MGQLAKRERVTIRAFDTGVVRHTAYGQNQNVISNRILSAFDEHFASIEINTGYLAADEVDVLIEQFFVIGRDVPGFDFAAEIFIKHRRKEKMVLVADKRYVT